MRLVLYEIREPRGDMMFGGVAPRKRRPITFARRDGSADGAGYCAVTI
jgi:hypothetical protein